MQVFKCAPCFFAALLAPALFAAPPAAAQDYRLVTAKAIGGAVSGMSEARAVPGLDQAGGADPVVPDQASRREETPARTGTGPKTPSDVPAQP